MILEPTSPLPVYRLLLHPPRNDLLWNAHGFGKILSSQVVAGVAAREGIPGAMDHGVDGNDSAIWSAPTEQTPRRPTRPPKDPLLQVTKLNASTLEHFQDALRGYLQNPPAEPEHSQCEIEVWGDATVLVSATVAT